MNTDPKHNQTRSGAPLHPEQAASDINQIGVYRVTLDIKEHRVAYVTVPTTSEERARKFADRCKAEHVWLWGTDVEVAKIELLHNYVKEGVTRE